MKKGIKRNDCEEKEWRISRLERRRRCDGEKGRKKLTELREKQAFQLLGKRWQWHWQRKKGDRESTRDYEHWIKQQQMHHDSYIVVVVYIMCVCVWKERGWKSRQKTSRVSLSLPFAIPSADHSHLASLLILSFLLFISFTHSAKIRETQPKLKWLAGEELEKL